MRMWNINPLYLCDKHLLGEHVEMHMFQGAIKKGTSLEGYISKGLVDTRFIKSRHDELVAEMQIRGMKHDSPLLYHDQIARGKVEARGSVDELASRCSTCRQRLILYGRYKSNQLPEFTSIKVKSQA